jgi:light-regulated signal transduction histidine kinase (bacteriophytochrome)
MQYTICIDSDKIADALLLLQPLCEFMHHFWITAETEQLADDKDFFLWKDGLVPIRSDSEEGRDIIISAFQNDERCLIQFRNQGQVIDPQHHLNSVFAPFYVQDLAHHHEGHGLSLAITKELIAAHHGNISVDSGSEGITVFTVNIPLSPTTETSL